MMKKILTIFTLLVMFIIPLFAERTSISGDNMNVNGSADVNVNFDLLNSAINNTWEIGFTSDITSLSSGSGTPLDSDSVSLVINGDHGELPDDSPLYVYWIITGSQRLKIELSASGELKGTPAGGSEESMNWQVTWSSSESGTGSSNTGPQTLGITDEYDTSSPATGTYTSQKVFTRDELDQSLEVGSSKLAIETQNITTVTPASYSAKLTLKISPLGS